MGRKPTDFNYLIGMRYNKLIITGWSRKILPNRGGSIIFVNVVCDCGNNKIAFFNNVKNGLTKSCGCGEHIKKYPAYLNSERSVYNYIKSCCYDKNHDQYKNYGRRGIRLCDRWLGKNGQLNFLIDVGKRPSANHRLRLIDYNSNFSRENCEWKSGWEIASIKIRKELLTKPEIAKILGLSRQRISQIDKSGMIKKYEIDRFGRFIFYTKDVIDYLKNRSGRGIRECA